MHGKCFERSPKQLSWPCLLQSKLDVVPELSNMKGMGPKLIQVALSWTHTEEMLTMKKQRLLWKRCSTHGRVSRKVCLAADDACAFVSVSGSLLPNMSALATSLGTATSLYTCVYISFQWLKYATSPRLPHFSSICTLRRKAQTNPSKQP